MTYSPGGIVRGPSLTVWFRPGPAPTDVNDFASIYEDECILNRHGVCVRNYPEHGALPIPTPNRWWSCPAHGDAAEPPLALQEAMMANFGIKLRPEGSD